MAAINTNMNDYYVYRYNREDGTPYYIGTGRGERMYDRHTSVRVPADPTRILVVAHKLSEHEAHRLEIKLIALFGRKDNGTGILRNLTNGGEEHREE